MHVDRTDGNLVEVVTIILDRGGVSWLDGYFILLENLVDSKK